MKRRDDRNEVFCQMVSEGASYGDIGKHFGITRSRASQIARRLGANLVHDKIRNEFKKVAALAVSSPKAELSLKRLQSQLYYDRHTGIWTWLVKKGKMEPGSVAGNYSTSGYIQIRVDRKLYMAHVLAWFYSFGVWPENMVDHQNRIRDDNRLNNLRQATLSQNLGNTLKRNNNTSGFKGVWKRGNKWIAEVGKIKFGTFDTREEAAVVVAQEAKKRYGEFACDTIDIMP